MNRAPETRHESSVVQAFAGSLKRRIATLYAFMFAANIALATWTLLAFRGQPALLATALLAYLLGLRHAVDPDHIAAIDNVTRKLMQDGQRPIAVGFWFALGHASMVILASVAVAFAAAGLQARFSAYREMGAVLATSVSAGFLLLIALFNLSVLIGLWRHWQKLKRGDAGDVDALGLIAGPSGLLSRLLRRLFAMISRSWHMFPIGLLFALGFDTASEIALYGLSASETVRSTGLMTLLIFPLLFTAGMTLVDTTDGVLMLGAYHWAYVNARRKLLYNIVITAISVIVALIIGSVEGLGLIADKFELAGGIWTSIAYANAHFGILGFVIIAIFVTAWGLSALIHRSRLSHAGPVLRPLVQGAAEDESDPTQGA